MHGLSFRDHHLPAPEAVPQSVVRQKPGQPDPTFTGHRLVTQGLALDTCHQPEAFGKRKMHRSLQAATCLLNRQLPRTLIDISQSGLLSREEESVWLSWQHQVAQDCWSPVWEREGQSPASASLVGVFWRVGVRLDTAAFFTLPARARGPEPHHMVWCKGAG